MKLVTRSQWGARSRSIPSNITPSGGVTIHYVGGPVHISSHSQCDNRVRGIQSHHINGNGWADIAYTALVCPHGYVYVGRGPNRRTAANGTNSGNQYWYAVCALIGGSQKPTAAMVQGITDAVAWLRRTGGAGNDVNGHRDHLPTSCPGNPLYAMVRNGTFGSGGTSSGGGGGGTARSVRGQQEAVNSLGYSPPLEVDGIFGPLTEDGVEWLQDKVGASVDGAWGPETERKYIEYLEDDVPTYVSVDKTENSRREQLAAGQWQQVYFDNNNSGGADDHHADSGDWPSLVRGPADYTGYISLRLSGVPEGVPCQARVVEVTEKDGSWEVVEQDFPVEFVGTGGDTFVTVPASGYVGADRRLRVEVVHFGDADVTPDVIGGRVRLQVWER